MHVGEIHYPQKEGTAVGDNRFDHHIIDWIVRLIPAPTQKASVGMYSGCDYPYKSCLCTF